MDSSTTDGETIMKYTNLDGPYTYTRGSMEGLHHPQPFCTFFHLKCGIPLFNIISNNQAPTINQSINVIALIWRKIMIIIWTRTNKKNQLNDHSF
jgi:hypothetical protein